MRPLGIAGIATIALLALSWTARVSPGRAKNVILFIGDGLGPAHMALGMHYAREVEGRKLQLQELMEEGETGYVLPISYQKVVTDSAAAATQIGTGILGRNESVGLDAEGGPLETILEWAERQGLATGIVTNMRLTHATPAALASHQIWRYNEEQNFADEMVMEHDIEVLLGGGARAMVPRGKRVSEFLPGVPAALDGDSRRSDDRNLVEEARARGYSIASDRVALREASPNATKLMGLFSATHLPYVVDRRAEKLENTPSLVDLTTAALDVLEQSGKGFFLLVEGGRIDYAGHDNDAGNMLHEILEFDEAVGVGRGFQSEHPDTLIIVTADHGTGGFSFSYQRDSVDPELRLPSGEVYQMRRGYPGKKELALLGRQSASFDHILERAGTDPGKLQEEVKRSTGLDLTWAEASRAAARSSEGVAEVCDFQEFYADDDDRASALLGRALARQTFVVWSTGGHTTEPILTFGSGPGAAALRGVYVNTHLHRVMRESLEGSE
jgi:alkaline phosphatase